MNSKNSLFIALACLSLGAVVNASGLIDSDSGLLSFMSRSNVLLQQNPARSVECFNYYIPLINQLAEGYEVNYKACLNVSAVDRANADNATWAQRNDLEMAASNSCDRLAKCGYSESVSDIFQCYIDGGSANINVMYLINANASEQLANLREQYYLIENKEFRCTNDTKRAYEKESADAYASLNSCIMGNSVVPSSPPSTTVIPTTLSTTSASEVISTANAPDSSNSPSSNENESSANDSSSTATEAAAS